MLRHGHSPEEHHLAQTARIGSRVGDVGSQFMLDGATYARGAELGFTGLNFYAAGRGGVLGRVPADVVVAAFTFIGPAMVRAGWDEGLGLLDPHQAAAEFIECGYQWGRTHLPASWSEGDDAERFVALTRKVTDDLVPYGVPLFAAWRAVPWPDDAPGRVLHAVHLLRELRGGVHVMAVMAQGVDPHAAVVNKSGAVVAEMLGWAAPHPDVDAHPLHEAVEAAERATDLQMAHAFSVLTDAELDELTELTARLRG